MSGSGKGRGIMDELLRAAAKVAKSQPTKQARKRTERDLRSMLDQHRQDTEAGKAGRSISSSIFIERQDSPVPRPPSRRSDFHERDEPSRGRDFRERDSPSRRPDFFERDAPPQQVRSQQPLNIMQSLLNETKRRRQTDPFNLGSGSRLGVFDHGEVEKWSTESKPGILETWTSLKKQEMNWMSTQPPRNAFEEMILWTEQGKLWKFPIDNEQGIEEERNVSFQEHIFLDSWFDGLPEKGPIRQFMEMFALGLSNNPYITVERKRQQFEWFKQYFQHNREILDKAGVL